MKSNLTKGKNNGTNRILLNYQDGEQTLFEVVQLEDGRQTLKYICFIFNLKYFHKIFEE